MLPMEAIGIETVVCSSERAWYDEYRRLRYRVFVVEQGWTGLSSEAEHDATLPDVADDGAFFWLARSASGALIGIVRVRSVADLFPHEDLFHHHLERPEMAAMRPWMGTLNSLAVDREWRGRPCRGPNGKVGTTASLLLGASLAGSADMGLRALLATAQTLISTRALMSAGFRVIDPPARTPLHACFLMCNVGTVLRGQEKGASALSSYFEDCQRRILNLRTLDEWFADKGHDRG